MSALHKSKYKSGWIQDCTFVTVTTPPPNCKRNPQEDSLCVAGIVPAGADDELGWSAGGGCAAA